MAKKQQTLRIVVLVLLVVFVAGYVAVSVPWATVLANTTYSIIGMVLLLAVLLAILWLLRKQSKTARDRRR